MTFDLSRLTDIKTKTNDELYGWTEREHPGTPQHTNAMHELARRKKRDNKSASKCPAASVVGALRLARFAVSAFTPSSSASCGVQYALRLPKHVVFLCGDMLLDENLQIRQFRYPVDDRAQA